MELEEAIKYLKDVKNKNLRILNFSDFIKATEKVLEELEKQKSMIKLLKDKMIEDGMEQFDDYNIYLISSYSNTLKEGKNDSQL